MFKSGDCGGHSKTFIHLSWRYFMVDFEVCFGSLSYWNTQPLFNFNVWTDLGTLASRIYWYLVESIIPSTRTIFPVPPAATQPQSIMDPPPCLTFGKVFFSINALPFFLHTYLQFLWFVTKKLHFGFASPKHVFPKGFRLLKVFFCVLQTLNFWFKL